MSETVSVVIPAYNAEKYLGEAIDSVAAALGGALSAAEIVVVSDGSTDGTAVVAAGNGGDAGEELGPAVGKRVEEVVALCHQVLKRGVDRRAEGPVPSALVQADCLAV